MGALIRGHDWASSPLGPVDAWPSELRTAVGLMLGASQPVYVAYGPDLTSLYNDGYLPIVGTKHPEGLGAPFSVLWAEIWEAFKPIVEATMAGEAQHFVNMPIALAGRPGVPVGYFTFSYTALRDDDGKAAGFYCAATETTEQVKQAEQLAQSEKRLQLALSAGRGIGAWDWDIPNDRVVADERFARLYGVDPDQAARGAPLAEFFTAVHPDDLPGLQAAIAHTLATGDTFSEEYRLVKPDGTARWVIAEGRPIMDAQGRPQRFPGVCFDVTDRREAENALRRLNAELERRVIERTQARGITWQVSPDLLGALNSEGYFETSNPAWQSLLGWSEAEVAATSIWELLHPEDLERTRTGFALTQIGQPAIKFPNRYRCKDGSYRWISWIGVFEDGYVYCSGRDITDEVAGAEELRLAHEQLRQSQKLEAIGQLTGGVAHDFNNLLTVIRGSIDMLRREGLNDARRARYVDAIGDTADRAAKLTAQLLAFARRQALRPETFDVRDSLNAILTVVRSLTGSRIEVAPSLPGAPCWVNADRNQFDTAVVNMVVNARDAMGGEGRIGISVRRVAGIPASNGHDAASGDFIAVAICDNGAGIAPENLEKVFDPFFTTKEVGAGTGLGLSQVIGFAKQSNGEVRVESALGGGSTFTLYLPRTAAAKAAAQTDADPDAAGPGDGICVLLVEDNPQVGEFATHALMELGYDSVLAPNADAALALLAEPGERFHIVFSDVVMPGRSGLDLAAEIGRLHPDVPVILTSGYSHVLAESGSNEVDLLHKPYSIDQLSVALRGALSRRR